MDQHHDSLGAELQMCRISYLMIVGHVERFVNNVLQSDRTSGLPTRKMERKCVANNTKIAHWRIREFVIQAANDDIIC